MTESEWRLRKELAQTKMAFAQSQSMLLQAEFNKAKADLDALGESWTAPEDNVIELKEAGA